jgi:hypothetical protein
MSARKVIISSAVTGSIHTPSMSPHLPVTAEEIAEAAIGAAEAGAAIVDLHARDPKDGRPASLRSVQTVPAKLSSSARTAWSTARPAAPRTCRWRSVCGRRRTGRVGWFNGKSPRGWLVDTSAPKSSLCRCETALIMLAAFSAITRVGARYGRS